MAGHKTGSLRAKIHREAVVVAFHVRTLHWLPVYDRIMFKFLLVGRASIIGAAPECTKALAFSDGNQTARRSLCSAARED